jgi:hypothetical protein
MELLEKRFWVALSFFGILLLVSLIFIVSSQKRGKPSFSLSSVIKGNGFFRLDKPANISVNSPFKVNFIANSDNKQVNAVALSVTFDPNKLSIINMDTTQSFCQFYPENKFSNDSGTISIQCGAPSPGFRGETTIASVTFLAKNMGETVVTINEKSQILLNDGKGTNIFTRPVNETLVILNNI